MIKKIIDIAIGAGKIILNCRKEGFQTQTKSHEFDFVTSADLKSEKYILERLSKEFPNDSILSEEKGKIGTNDASIWMVDPLDGTKDFKNGGTGFSVMIALCKNGVPVLGVVYAPAQELLYFAQKDKGSFIRIKNIDYPMHVSLKDNINNSVLVTRFVNGEKRAEDAIEDLYSVKEKIPEGSVGTKIGLIASGKADFHIHTNSRASKWDTCAPQIILEEAGGKITDFYGNKLDYLIAENNWKNSFVASNSILHEKILLELKKGYLKK